VSFELGDEEFLELSFEKDVDRLVYKKVWFGTIEVSLYACPKCGIIKMGGGN